MKTPHSTLPVYELFCFEFGGDEIFAKVQHYLIQIPDKRAIFQQIFFPTNLNI